MEENQVQVRQQNGVAKKKPSSTEFFLDLVSKQADIEKTPLTEKEISYAVGIIANANRKINDLKITWNDVDFMGCQLPQQIKRFARLGMSIEENDIFIDIRNHKDSNLKDINIKKQYQGIEKEIMRFCSKNVVRFYRDVICEGDDFKMQTDFATGLQKIVNHEYAEDVDRNKLENIIGAYEIAYVEEDGKLNQYIGYVDKNRIMRAYNASASREKTVWKLDTRLMVLKTATWVLYNNVMKPYMQVPTELLDDWKATQDEMDFDNEQPKPQFHKPDIKAIDIDDIEINATSK